jgi:hypothetical protein
VPEASVVSVTIRLFVGRSGFRIPVWPRDFFFSSRPSRPAVRPIEHYFQWLPMVLSRRESSRGVKVIVYLCLVPRVRKSGSVPLLRLYTFTEWTGIPFWFSLCDVTSKRFTSKDAFNNFS